MKERSPLCPETQTPASFSQRLYQPGEQVLVFDVFKSQGRYLCQCLEPPYDAECLNHLIHGCKDGVWFLCNPVDGEYHPNPRQGGKLSRRSEESVTAWPYLVLESDEADAWQWLAILVQLPLRLAAIYTSGGRSIHALAREAFANIIVCREDSLMSEEFFTQRVIPLLEQHQPDLLWIDPALAYLGGETNSQKDGGRFLRNQLNPVLNARGCGRVIVHHTNKPPSGREKPNWQAGDFAYLGSGSAEWANWARAVLVMRAVGSHRIFELRAGKRGPRLGWRAADGETRLYAKYIAHADAPGVICWREAQEPELLN